MNEQHVAYVIYELCSGSCMVYCKERIDHASMYTCIHADYIYINKHTYIDCDMHIYIDIHIYIYTSKMNTCVHLKRMSTYSSSHTQRYARVPWPRKRGTFARDDRKRFYQPGRSPAAQSTPDFQKAFIKEYTLA